MKLSEKILDLTEKLYTEKLSLMNKNNDNDNYETFVFSVKSAEELSNDFKLPLKVKGTFLKPGKPKDRYYSLETLQKIPDNTKLPIPFHSDHEDKKVANIVGAVTDLKIEEDVGRYYGHVNDEKTARNIIDGVITDVSVTIYSKPIPSSKYGIEGIGAFLTEISFVKQGAEEANSIEIDK